jgi:hypothetical protein
VIAPANTKPMTVPIAWNTPFSGRSTRPRKPSTGARILTTKMMPLIAPMKAPITPIATPFSSGISTLVKNGIAGLNA